MPLSQEVLNANYSLIVERIDADFILETQLLRLQYIFSNDEEMGVLVRAHELSVYHKDKAIMNHELLKALLRHAKDEGIEEQCSSMLEECGYKRLMPLFVGNADSKALDQLKGRLQIEAAYEVAAAGENRNVLRELVLSILQKNPNFLNELITRPFVDRDLTLRAMALVVGELEPPLDNPKCQAEYVCDVMSRQGKIKEFLIYLGELDISEEDRNFLLGVAAEAESLAQVEAEAKTRSFLSEIEIESELCSWAEAEAKAVRALSHLRIGAGTTLVPASFKAKARSPLTPRVPPMADGLRVLPESTRKTTHVVKPPAHELRVSPVSTRETTPVVKPPAHELRVLPASTRETTIENFSRIVKILNYGQFEDQCISLDILSDEKRDEIKGKSGIDRARVFLLTLLADTEVLERFVEEVLRKKSGEYEHLIYLFTGHDDPDGRWKRKFETEDLYKKVIRPYYADLINLVAWEIQSGFDASEPLVNTYIKLSPTFQEVQENGVKMDDKWKERVRGLSRFHQALELSRKISEQCATSGFIAYLKGKLEEKLKKCPGLMVVDTETTKGTKQAIAPTKKDARSKLQVLGEMISKKEAVIGKAGEEDREELKKLKEAQLEVLGELISKKEGQLKKADGGDENQLRKDLEKLILDKKKTASELEALELLVQEVASSEKEAVLEQMVVDTETTKGTKQAAISPEEEAALEQKLELEKDTRSSVDVTKLLAGINLLSKIEARAESAQVSAPVVGQPEAEVSFVQGVLKKVMEGMEALKRIPQEREAALKAVQAPIDFAKEELEHVDRVAAFLKKEFQRVAELTEENFEEVVIQARKARLKEAWLKKVLTASKALERAKAVLEDMLQRKPEEAVLAELEVLEGIIPEKEAEAQKASTEEKREQAELDEVVQRREELKRELQAIAPTKKEAQSGLEVLGDMISRKEVQLKEAEETDEDKEVLKKELEEMARKKEKLELVVQAVVSPGEEAAAQRKRESLEREIAVFEGIISAGEAVAKKASEAARQARMGLIVVLQAEAGLKVVSKAVELARAELVEASRVVRFLEEKVPTKEGHDAVAQAKEDRLKEVLTVSEEVERVRAVLEEVFQGKLREAVLTMESEALEGIISEEEADAQKASAVAEQMEVELNEVVQKKEGLERELQAIASTKKDSQFELGALAEIISKEGHDAVVQAEEGRLKEVLTASEAVERLRAVLEKVFQGMLGEAVLTMESEALEGIISEEADAQKASAVVEQMEVELNEVVQKKEGLERELQAIAPTKKDSQFELKVLYKIISEKEAGIKTAETDEERGLLKTEMEHLLLLVVQIKVATELEAASKAVELARAELARASQAVASQAAAFLEEEVSTKDMLKVGTQAAAQLGAVVSQEAELARAELAEASQAVAFLKEKVLTKEGHDAVAQAKEGRLKEVLTASEAVERAKAALEEVLRGKPGEAALIMESEELEGIISEKEAEAQKASAAVKREQAELDEVVQRREELKRELQAIAPTKKEAQSGLEVLGDMISRKEVQLKEAEETDENKEVLKKELEEMARKKEKLELVVQAVVSPEEEAAAQRKRESLEREVAVLEGIIPVGEAVAKKASEAARQAQAELEVVVQLKEALAGAELARAELAKTSRAEKCLLAGVLTGEVLEVMRRMKEGDLEEALEVGRQQQEMLEKTYLEQKALADEHVSEGSKIFSEVNPKLLGDHFHEFPEFPESVKALWQLGSPWKLAATLVGIMDVESREQVRWLCDALKDSGQMVAVSIHRNPRRKEPCQTACEEFRRMRDTLTELMAATDDLVCKMYSKGGIHFYDYLKVLRLSPQERFARVREFLASVERGQWNSGNGSAFDDLMISLKETGQDHVYDYLKNRRQDERVARFKQIWLRRDMSEFAGVLKKEPLDFFRFVDIVKGLTCAGILQESLAGALKLKALGRSSYENLRALRDEVFRDFSFPKICMALEIVKIRSPELGKKIETDDVREYQVRQRLAQFGIRSSKLGRKIETDDVGEYQVCQRLVQLGGAAGFPPAFKAVFAAAEAESAPASPAMAGWESLRDEAASAVRLLKVEPVPTTHPPLDKDEESSSSGIVFSMEKFPHILKKFSFQRFQDHCYGRGLLSIPEIRRIKAIEDEAGVIDQNRAFLLALLANPEALNKFIGSVLLGGESKEHQYELLKYLSTGCDRDGRWEKKFQLGESYKEAVEHGFLVYLLTNYDRDGHWSEYWKGKLGLKEICERAIENWPLVYLLTDYDPDGHLKEAFEFEKCYAEVIRPYHERLVELTAARIRDEFDPSEPLENVYDKLSPLFQRAGEAGIKMGRGWKAIMRSLSHFPQAIKLLEEASEQCATRKLLACLKESLEEKLKKNTPSATDTGSSLLGIKARAELTQDVSTPVKEAKEAVEVLEKAIQEKAALKAAQEQKLELLAGLKLLAEIETRAESIRQAPRSVVEPPSDAVVSFVQGHLRAVSKAVGALDEIILEKEATLRAFHQLYLRHEALQKVNRAAAFLQKEFPKVAELKEKDWEAVVQAKEDQLKAAQAKEASAAVKQAQAALEEANQVVAFIKKDLLVAVVEAKEMRLKEALAASGEEKLAKAEFEEASRAVEYLKEGVLTKPALEVMFRATRDVLEAEMREKKAQEKKYLEAEASAGRSVLAGWELFSRVDFKHLADHCYMFKDFPKCVEPLWQLSEPLELALVFTRIMKGESIEQVRNLCYALIESDQMKALGMDRSAEQEKRYREECEKLENSRFLLVGLMVVTNKLLNGLYSKGAISHCDLAWLVRSKNIFDAARKLLDVIERNLWFREDAFNIFLLSLKEECLEGAYHAIKNGRTDDRAERFNEHFRADLIRLGKLFAQENGSLPCLFGILDRLSDAGVTSKGLVDDAKKQLTGTSYDMASFFRDKVLPFCSFHQICKFLEIIETTHPEFAKVLMTRDVREYRARAVHRTCLVAIKGENFLTREACQLAAIQLLDRELRAYKVPRQDREKRLIACQASLDAPEQKQKREEYLVSCQRYLGNRTPGFFSSATIAALPVRKAEEPSSEEPEAKKVRISIR